MNISTYNVHYMFVFIYQNEIGRQNEKNKKHQPE